uniref:Uncharacterized protein n=1 Tax=Setaria viridis TaxID=4556 RepID=A0A4U6VFI5_SETVI|nr:hypothetical protein SEVIR_3G328500v2 [Setaria viridis]
MRTSRSHSLPELMVGTCDRQPSLLWHPECHPHKHEVTHEVGASEEQRSRLSPGRRAMETHLPFLFLILISFSTQIWGGLSSGCFARVNGEDAGDLQRTKDGAPAADQRGGGTCSTGTAAPSPLRSATSSGIVRPS